MPAFLTVTEAAKLTGKSASSIRRIIHPITKDDAHPDRSHIQPGAEEAKALRLKGENFAWRISEELLRRALPAEPAAEKGNGASSARPPLSGDGGLLDMLRRELDIKNLQITQQSELIVKQMEVMNGLSERLREGNILIAGLQQRLALSDGRDAAPPKPAKGSDQTDNNASEPVKTKRPVSPGPEKGSKVTPKPAKPKKGFWSHLLGRRS